MTDPLVGRADARTPLTQEERVSVELFKDNTPSVVFITNLAVRLAAFQVLACMHSSAESLLFSAGMRMQYSCISSCLWPHKRIILPCDCSE